MYMQLHIMYSVGAHASLYTLESRQKLSFWYFGYQVYLKTMAMNHNAEWFCTATYELHSGQYFRYADSRLLCGVPLMILIGN